MSWGGEVETTYARNASALQSVEEREELLARLARDLDSFVPSAGSRADVLLAALREDLASVLTTTTPSSSSTSSPSPTAKRWRRAKWWTARVGMLDVLLAYEFGEAYDLDVLRHDGQRLRTSSLFIQSINS